MSRKDRDGMSKRELFRERRRRTQTRNRIISIGLVVFGALLLALFLIGPNLQPTNIKTVTPLTRPETNFNEVGDPNALVVVDEYADFQCPACAFFSKNTEQALLDAYVTTGKVLFRFHSVGRFIDSRDPAMESVQSAEAAYCAGDQNKLWEYHDYLLGNQLGENVGSFTDRRLTAIAETLGLDMSQFNSCYNNQKYREKVLEDGAEAQSRGITSTPTFIISYEVNGQTVTDTITRAEAFSVFQQKLDAALAAAGAQ